MSNDPTPASPAPAGAAAGSAVRILILLAIAAGVLWWAGVFKSKPKLVIITSGDTPYWDLVEAGANEAARQYDVKLTVIRCKTDVDAQSQTIRDTLRQKWDGVGISPVNPMAQAAILAEVAGATTLVTLDSDSPLSRRFCFVGTDNYHAGRLCGEQLRTALPDGGEVIIVLGSAEKDNTQRRRQGVIDELLGREFEPNHPADPIEGVLKGDKFTIVTTLVDGSDATKCTELAAAAIKEHSGVDAFVGLLGYSTPAILKAVDQAGRTGKIIVVGFDNAEETLAGIEGGAVSASILQDQFGCGFQTVRILAEKARGHTSGGLPMFQQRTLPCEVINKDNVGAIRQQLKAPTAAAGAGM